MKKGIDIYKYNAVNDYDKLASAIDFIILQIGYGVSYSLNQKDFLFDQRYAALHGKIPIGVYYYAYGKKKGDGVKEAQNCLKYLEGRELELPIYYDIEDAKNANHDLITREFVDTIRAAGYRPGVYTYTSYAASHMHLDKFSDCSLWMAAYGKNDGSMLDKYKPKHADIWQYTSNGTVPGMPNRVDMNVLLNEAIIGGNDMTKAETNALITEKLVGANTKPSNWAKENKTIETAVNMGITATGDCPGGYVTREQAMQMCIKTAKYVIEMIKDDVK